MKPLFSIIVATYNSATTIEQCLGSISSQTEPAQIVVIDGASNDDTVERVRRVAAEATLLVEPDNGVFDAWNKALALSRGDWLIFIGSDDYFDDPSALQRLRQFLEGSVDASRPVYGRVKVVDESGASLHTENAEWRDIAHTLPRNMPFTHVGTAHHRSLFESRRFDTRYRIAGDYHFLYPVLRDRGARFCSDYSVCMRAGGLSKNLRTRRELLRELLRMRADHGIVVPLRNRLWTGMKRIAFSLIPGVR